ncbi:MAG: glycerophosphodiester phosphodiesterase [Candidatus Binatia bacterium]
MHARRLLIRRGLAALAALALLAGCGDGGDTAPPAVQTVRDRLDGLAPAANLAHRGVGMNRPQSALAENSLAAFRLAMAQGADGIELDVEITADGRLVVMHDDRLDRTTTCSGCVSAYPFAALRDCRLVNYAREVSAEPPPTLAEVYAALPADALVNVELKVYGGACLTPTTGAEALARRAVREVRGLGVADRTLFSSFDDAAAVAIKQIDAALYSALLVRGAPPGTIEHAADLGLDALHPFFTEVDAPAIATARGLGLQVNLWTVVTRELLEQALDKQPTAIITDEPDVLAEILAERRPARSVSRAGGDR